MDEAQKTELNFRRWEAEYRAKAEMEAQGFRGLTLINGGAAVALGALLQAIVGKPEAQALIPWVLYGVALNAAGVAFTAPIFWVRYMQGLHEKAHKKFLRSNPWWAWRWYLGGAALLAFVASAAVVVIGGFCTLT
jgi:hypothetical protein